MDVAGIVTGTDNQDVHDKLIDAAHNDCVDEVKKLVQMGANINYISANPQHILWPTVLHNAILHNNMELIRFLVANGADVNISPNRCSTPLHWAISSRSLQLVTYLLDNGAAPNGVSYWETTPLGVAVVINSMEIVTILIIRGAEITKKNAFGASPLDIAAKMGHTEMLEFLSSFIDSRHLDVY